MLSPITLTGCGIPGTPDPESYAKELWRSAVEEQWDFEACLEPRLCDGTRDAVADNRAPVKSEWQRYNDLHGKLVSGEEADVSRWDRADESGPRVDLTAHVQNKERSVVYRFSSEKNGTLPESLEVVAGLRQGRKCCFSRKVII